MDLAAAFKTATGLHQAMRLTEAMALYDRILEAAPDHPETLYLRATVDLQQERYAAALLRFDRALALKPDYAAAQANRAAALLALGRYSEALAGCDKALGLNPASANVLGNRATVLAKLGRPEHALADAERALALESTHVRALTARAEALHALGRQQEALASIEQVIAATPNDAEAQLRRGALLLDLERFNEALSACDRAIAQAPQSTIAHDTRGTALARLHRPAEAIAAYDRALTLDPGYAAGHRNRAVALSTLERLDEALAGFDRALALAPESAEVFAARSLTLRRLGRHEEAIADCSRALDLKPDFAPARISRAYALAGLQRFEEAIADGEIALAAKPHTQLLRGDLLFWTLQIARWDNLPTKIEGCLRDLDAGDAGTGPFTVAMLPASLTQRRTAAARYFADNTPAPAPHRWPPARAGKIRLGYFSADFFDHAVSQLAVGLFEHHDRTQFEVIAFAFGSTPRDAMRARLEKAFDRFIDVSTMSDREVTDLARVMNIHIAIDLTGLTRNSRPAVFALGAAPIQVNFLGYPGTIGSDRYAYIIGDAVVTPPEHKPYYSENIVTLPHTYQPSDRCRPISERVFTRRELGLPDDGFVFCSFNNTYKITPDMFHIWMRILAVVDKSVLWLRTDNPDVMQNFRGEASARGVAPARLVFAPRLSAPEHLARHRAADLFLDTFPYNAHTTASDALWAGLPVLTKLDEAFSGRVAASLLTAAGLPELITKSVADYEALAVALAQEPSRLIDLKRRLDATRLGIPLFDTARYTRNLETAYRRMWERYAAGQTPAPLTVEAG